MPNVGGSGWLQRERLAPQSNLWNHGAANGLNVEIAGIEILMQRFYFDVYNTEHSQTDGEGQFFADREKAGMEALRILHDVARDEMPGGTNLKITVKVLDDKRDQVFEASLTLDSAWS